METLYRKINVSEQNPTKSGEYHTNEGLVFYSSSYNGFEHNTDPHRVYPDWWLEEIPDPTAQLQADKAELLEALEQSDAIIRNRITGADSLEEAKSILDLRKKVESLSQKHNPCGTA